jgi:hypothetical protein
VSCSSLGLDGAFSAAAKGIREFVVDNVLEKLEESLALIATAPAPIGNLVDPAKESLKRFRAGLVKLLDGSFKTCDVNIAKSLREAYPEIDGDLARMEALLRQLTEFFDQLDPKALAGKLRQELQAVAKQFQDEVKRSIKARIDALADGLCAQIQAVVTNLLGNIRLIDMRKLPWYLSTEAGNALVGLQKSLQAILSADETKCRTGLGTTELANLMRSLRSVRDLLSRSLSITGIGHLVNLDAILDQIVSSFGIPSKLRISYDWDTTVHAFPEGDGAIFAPVDDGKLTINAVMEANLRGGGTPTASMSATLAPFHIHLFGAPDTAGNFLSIRFSELVMTLQPGKGLDCKTDVEDVRPGRALEFVKALSSVFGGRSGFRIIPSFHGIKVGYE